MNSISIADIAEKKVPFNLDVLCKGAVGVADVPVEVYFEGDSDGRGRLNLESGGAKGVEISLSSDQCTAAIFCGQCFTYEFASG